MTARARLLPLLGLVPTLLLAASSLACYRSTCAVLDDKGCCPDGEVRDSDGVCCPDDEVDDEGLCPGEYYAMMREDQEAWAKWLGQSPLPLELPLSEEAAREVPPPARP